MSRRRVIEDVSDPFAGAPPSPFTLIRTLAGGAFMIIAVFIGGFGVWAAQAPLESAAIALGAIEAETSRKTVQHFEGGIVAQILIKDGDPVEPGQVLIRLDDTRPKATLAGLKGQLWDLMAREARLAAERDEREQIAFPLTLLAAAEQDKTVQDVVTGQTRIFEARRNLKASRINVIRQQMAQTDQEIQGLQAQREAARKRLSIIQEEISAIAPLVEQGLQTRPRLLSLEREQAEIFGRSGDLQARVAKARQALGEFEEQILKIRHDDQTFITQTLRDTQNALVQVQERMQAAADVLARTEVKAPEAGVVTDLKIHTTGGVIAAGEALMDIVPKEDRLIIRAQVKPEDIDLVRPGLPAMIKLLPYKQRRVAPADGVLIYVSADRLIDKKTDQPYYAARLKLEDASLKELTAQGVDILPGMPVEVLIKTGRFTAAHYALAPLLDSFNRAFREN